MEREVAVDLAKRGLLISPAVLALAFLASGPDGAASAAFALGIVCVNFLLSAAIIGWAAPMGPGMLMGATMGGYVLRLGVVTAAVIAVRDLPWVAMRPLGLTLIATHLGLLFWETKHVSLTLAHPGLKPREEV